MGRMKSLFNRAKFRQEQLGWFVAAILFVVLAHIMVFASASYVRIMQKPSSIFVFTTVMAWASVMSLTYHSARTFSRLQWGWFLRNSEEILRGMVIMGTGVLVGFLIGPFVPSSLHVPLISFILIGGYTYSIIIGWVFGKLRMVNQFLDNPSVSDKGESLWKILGRKSEKFVVSIITISILTGVIATILYDFFVGATIAGSLAGYLDLFLRLSDEMREEDADNSSKID